MSLESISLSAAVLALAGLLALLVNAWAWRSYARDRRRAVQSSLRLPQRALLRQAFWGGWPAAKLVVMRSEPGVWSAGFRRRLNRAVAGPLALLAAVWLAVLALGDRRLTRDDILSLAESVLPAGWLSQSETAEPVMPRRFGPGS